MLICVSGSSGVGKTTLTRLFESVLGSAKTVCLSGDDLHRWDRYSDNWKFKTHLDPTANDLEMGHDHIVRLIRGETIHRSFYNHDSGTFDDPVVIFPKDFVVYEGLHALYHKPTAELADVAVFVDTEDDLKTEWKVKRDTKKRGYTESQVLETMRRRRKDELSFITPQRERADVIVKFNKNRDGVVSLEYVSISDRGSELMEKVKDYYDSMTEFMSVCKWLSLDPSLVQGRGGNVSVKSNSGLIVKSSGFRMADVNLHHGFCLCGVDCPLPYFSNEDQYNRYITDSKKMGDGRPSMETGFHALLQSKVIVHTHPIHLNAILCSKEAKSLVKSIFNDMSYDFVGYTRPGMNLMNRMRDCNRVVFLENHGLVVGAETAQEAFETTERVNNRCKRWLGNHVESLVDIDEVDTTVNPLFPDAAVFPSEMGHVNNYIHSLLTAACLTPKFIEGEEVAELNEMSSEKYRKSLS